MHKILRKVDIRQETCFKRMNLTAIERSICKKLYCEICKILAFELLESKDIRVIINGDSVPNSLLSSEGTKIQNESVIDLYSRGATIILNGADRFCKTLTLMRQELKDALGRSVHANVYLTPRSSSGVGYHVDSHDVLFLQVDGSKKWYFKGSDTGENSIVTDVGHWYFFESGVEHKTRTINDYSMHITFGLDSIKQLHLSKREVTNLPAIRSPIESINAITEKTQSFHLRPIVDKLEISSFLSCYLERYSNTGRYMGLRQYFEKCTYEEILEFIDAPSLSAEVRIKALKLLVKSGVVEIYENRI